MGLNLERRAKFQTASYIFPDEPDDLIFRRFFEVLEMAVFRNIYLTDIDKEFSLNLVAVLLLQVDHRS